MSGCGGERTLRDALSLVAPELAPEPDGSQALDSSKVADCFENATVAEAVRTMLEPQNFALIVGENGHIERLIILSTKTAQAARTRRASLPGAQQRRARENVPPAPEKGEGAENNGGAPERGATEREASSVASVEQPPVSLDDDLADASDPQGDEATNEDESGASSGPFIPLGNSSSTQSVARGSIRSSSSSTPTGSSGSETDGGADAEPPPAAEPVRVEFTGSVSALEPGGSTRPGNVFSVSGNSTYSGFVEIDLDVFTSQFLNDPLSTDADGNPTAIQIGPEQDPSIRFGLSIGAEQRFSEADADAAFNEPLVTFGVKATIERTDPDGPGPERPFDTVVYGDMKAFFLRGVTLLSDPISIGTSEYSLLYLSEPTVRCVTRRGTSDKDCFLSSGSAGEVSDETFGRTEVGLEALEHSSADGVRPVSTDSDDSGSSDPPSSTQ